MDNNKRRWKQGREVGNNGVVRRGGGERKKTVLEQQLKNTPVRMVIIKDQENVSVRTCRKNPLINWYSHYEKS